VGFFRKYIQILLRFLHIWHFYCTLSSGLLFTRTQCICTLFMFWQLHDYHDKQQQNDQLLCWTVTRLWSEYAWFSSQTNVGNRKNRKQKQKITTHVIIAATISEMVCHTISDIVAAIITWVVIFCFCFLFFCHNDESLTTAVGRTNGRFWLSLHFLNSPLSADLIESMNLNNNLHWWNAKSETIESRMQS